MSVHKGYCLQNLKISVGSQIFLARLAQTSNCPPLPAGSYGQPQRRGRGALLQLCLSQAPEPVRSQTLVVPLLGPSAHATWADRQAEREITGEKEHVPLNQPPTQPRHSCEALKRQTLADQLLGKYSDSSPRAYLPLPALFPGPNTPPTEDNIKFDSLIVFLIDI